MGQVQASRSNAAVAQSFNMTVHNPDVMVRFCQTGDVS